jgi:hypothetical protein
MQAESRRDERRSAELLRKMVAAQNELDDQLTLIAAHHRRRLVNLRVELAIAEELERRFSDA